MRSRSLWVAVLAAAVAACSDGPIEAPRSESSTATAATPITDPRFAEARPIWDAARKALKLPTRGRYTIGVLDSGRTFSEATVLLMQEGSAPQAFRFGRAAGTWNKLRDLGRLPSRIAPTSAPTSNDVEYPLLGFIGSNLKAYYLYFPHWQLMPGSYWTYYYPDEGESFFYAGWFTPSRMEYDHRYSADLWGWLWNTQPSCPYGYAFESSWRGLEFNRWSYNCPVEFAGAAYSVNDTYHPGITVYLSGQTQINEADLWTWHAWSEGGLDQVEHQWEWSLDGANWNATDCNVGPHITVSDCSFFVGPDEHYNFYIKVTAYSHWYMDKWSTHIRTIYVNTPPVSPPDPPEDPPPPPPPPPPENCAPYCELRAAPDTARHRPVFIKVPLKSRVGVHRQ